MTKKLLYSVISVTKSLVIKGNSKSMKIFIPQKFYIHVVFVKKHSHLLMLEENTICTTILLIHPMVALIVKRNSKLHISSDITSETTQEKSRMCVFNVGNDFGFNIILNYIWENTHMIKHTKHTNVVFVKSLLKPNMSWTLIRFPI